MQIREIGKKNNVTVFESNKANGPQQDQIWIRSPMPEGKYTVPRPLCNKQLVPKRLDEK
jgi:hypothetical protein